MQSFSVKGKGYINAAGPWADLLMEKIEPENATQIHRSKGIHLVLPKQQSNVTILYYVQIQTIFLNSSATDIRMWCIAYRQGKISTALWVKSDLGTLAIFQDGTWTFLIFHKLRQTL